MSYTKLILDCYKGFRKITAHIITYSSMCSLNKKPVSDGPRIYSLPIEYRPFINFLIYIAFRGQPDSFPRMTAYSSWAIDCPVLRVRVGINVASV